MIEPGSTCYIKRDIYAGGALLFKEGEIVIIEKVGPHPQRPEYKYLTFSARAKKYFLLSDRDLELETEDIKDAKEEVNNTKIITPTPPGKPPGAAATDKEKTSYAPLERTGMPIGRARSGKKNVIQKVAGSNMSKIKKVLVVLFISFVLLSAFSVFLYYNLKEKTPKEETVSEETSEMSTQTELEPFEEEVSFEELISIENLVEGQQMTAGKYTVSGRALQTCSLDLNGVPVEILQGTGEFHHPVTINEGENTLSFIATDENGELISKEIRVTGVVTPQMYKASCPPGPPYKVLEKNADAYIGTRCYYKGKVAQAMESSGITMLRVNITHKGYDIWDDTIYVTLEGSTPAVEDSMVIVYGDIAGSYTYESIAGWIITLPWIMAEYVDVVG